jgi:hypothetical protein
MRLHHERTQSPRWKDGCNGLRPPSKPHDGAHVGAFLVSKACDRNALLVHKTVNSDVLQHDPSSDMATTPIQRVPLPSPLSHDTPQLWPQTPPDVSLAATACMVLATAALFPFTLPWMAPLSPMTPLTCCSDTRGVRLWVALDLEFDTNATCDADFDETVGVACAAVHTVWSSGHEDTAVWVPGSAKGAFERSLAPHDVGRLVDDLFTAASEGASVVTHGGAACDFRVLHAVLRQHGDAARAARVLALAQCHEDIALVSATQSGHCMSLLSLCKGMGLPCKADAASAAAAHAWCSGDPEQQQSVLCLVTQDARNTSRIYAALTHEGSDLQWVTARGHTLRLRLGLQQRYLSATGSGRLVEALHPWCLPTVAACAALPLPRTRFKAPNPKLQHTALTAWLSRDSPPPTIVQAAAVVDAKEHKHAVLGIIK